MQQEVTQQMREYVTVALEEHLLLQKSGHDPVVLPDDIISLMYSAADIDHRATIDTIIGEAAYLFKEYCGRDTVREHLVLRQYFNREDNLRVRIMLLLGLHHPERNREPMKVEDPVSVQQNIALLKSIKLIHQSNDKRLLDKAVAYKDDSLHQQGQGFRDNHCADMIIDYPEHCELFINTMMERGYEEGIEVFKHMMATKSPALMHGAL